MGWRAALLLLVCCSATPVFAQPAPVADPEELSIVAFLRAVERAATSRTPDAWLALTSDNGDPQAARDFFDAMVPEGVTRAVVRERDRSPLAGALPGEGYRLLTEVLLEIGSRGRLSTWRIDVRRPRGEFTDEQPWRIVAQDRVSSVEGLHRLTLAGSKQYTATDLSIRSVDFELRLPRGDVFVADTDEGTTALVLLGDGVMRFAPEPREERGQVRIFAGSETIETPFTWAFVRISPYDFEERVQQAGLVEAPVDERTLRRAQSTFSEHVSRSFALDLSDMSRDTWSLLPQPGDFLAEVRTRRFDTLTYARSMSEPEDVSLFNRLRKRNIASYASPQKLVTRGRYYDESDLVDYDILDTQIDVTFLPEREWLEGRTRLRLRVKSFALAAITLRLADPLTVNSVVSDELGRLLFLRVKDQNSLVINLPEPAGQDAIITLALSYQGRLPTQKIDQESLLLQQAGQRVPREGDTPVVPAEEKWLFSNRANWYPQGTVTDYGTATIRITVPLDFTVVASGERVEGTPVLVAPPTQNQAGRMLYMFSTREPARYLAAVISRLVLADAATVALDIVLPEEVSTPLLSTNGNAPVVRPPGSRNTLQLTVDANRRQEPRGREALPTAAEIVRLYSRLVGDAPYSSLTLAMLEDDLPGGHSPPYFAVVNSPLPSAPLTWRNDPAAFSNFPEFFIAHEVAHQWWGHAVGWKNYHEQWISESFAQYFAALFARERRGEEAYRDILKQWRRWAMEQSDQGPVSLGYRLGHIKGDTRVFRALVYNKGASVLHMLRQLLGEERFFEGLREFYVANRFKKAGTDDVRLAMEKVSGRSLTRFFERWIHDTTTPRVQASTSVEGDELVVKVEQAEAVDFPLLVTVTYADDRREEHVMTIGDTSTEARFRLAGTLKGVEFNQDHGALVTVERR